MPKGDVETYWQQDTWKTKHEGSDRAISTHSTKDDAVSAGRQIAQRDRVEHIIKNQDGAIAERNSYGNDPRNVPRLTRVPIWRAQRRREDTSSQLSASTRRSAVLDLRATV